MPPLPFTESPVPAVAKSSCSSASPAEKGRLPTYSFLAIYYYSCPAKRDDQTGSSGVQSWITGPERPGLHVCAGVRLGARTERRAVIQPDGGRVAQLSGATCQVRRAKCGVRRAKCQVR